MRARPLFQLFRAYATQSSTAAENKVLTEAAKEAKQLPQLQTKPAPKIDEWDSPYVWNFPNPETLEDNAKLTQYFDRHRIR